MSRRRAPLARRRHPAPPMPEEEAAALYNRDYAARPPRSRSGDGSGDESNLRHGAPAPATSSVQEGCVFPRLGWRVFAGVGDYLLTWRLFSKERLSRTTYLVSSPRRKYSVTTTRLPLMLAVLAGALAVLSWVD